jgi:hypothetical protein
MIKKVNSLLGLCGIAALTLYWMKIDQRGLGLFVLMIVICFIQLNSIVTFPHKPLIKYLLITISLSGISLATFGLLMEPQVFSFIIIQPVVYGLFTKDPNLQSTWKSD